MPLNASLCMLFSRLYVSRAAHKLPRSRLLDHLDRGAESALAIGPYVPKQVRAAALGTERIMQPVFSRNGALYFEASGPPNLAATFCYRVSTAHLPCRDSKAFRHDF
jgi:hypothetical protein